MEAGPQFQVRPWAASAPPAAAGVRSGLVFARSGGGWEDCACKPTSRPGTARSRGRRGGTPRSGGPADPHAGRGGRIGYSAARVARGPCPARPGQHPAGGARGGPPSPWNWAPASRRPTARSRRTCSAAPWKRPASTRSTSTATSRPVSAMTRPVSTAAGAPCARATCSSSGSSTPSAGISPAWSTPWRTCRPAARSCRCSPATGRRGRHLDRGRPDRVRHLRDAGGVRVGGSRRCRTGGSRGRGGVTRTPASAGMRCPARYAPRGTAWRRGAWRTWPR